MLKRPEFATEEYISDKLKELAAAKKISLDIAFWESDWSDTLYIVIQRYDKDNKLSRPVHEYADHHLTSMKQLDAKLEVLVNRCSYMPLG